MDNLLVQVMIGMMIIGSVLGMELNQPFLTNSNSLENLSTISSNHSRKSSLDLYLNTNDTENQTHSIRLEFAQVIKQQSVEHLKQLIEFAKSELEKKITETQINIDKKSFNTTVQSDDEEELNGNNIYQKKALELKPTTKNIAFSLLSANNM